jgi:hypothetical protein
MANFTRTTVGSLELTCISDRSALRGSVHSHGSAWYGWFVRLLLAGLPNTAGAGGTLVDHEMVCPRCTADNDLLGFCDPEPTAG